MTKLLTAALAAQAWFNEHPKRIAVGVLAATASNRQTNATDERAACFCALGRVCKELNIPVSMTGDAVRALQELDPRFDEEMAAEVYNRNDITSMDEKGNLLSTECGPGQLGSIDGINYLVEKLNG
jgi:hypothetical protein